MIKHIALLTKKAGWSHENFVRRYEEGHVPLVNKVYPFFAAYRRNYVVPDGNLSLAKDEEGGQFPQSFDVFTEFWFPDQAAVDALSRCAAETDAADRVACDEEVFLDRSRTIIVECEERITPASLLKPKPQGHQGKPRVKYVSLARARAGMGRDELISLYENGHARLGLELLRSDGASIFASYSRTYTGGDRNFEHLGYDSRAFGFDMMTQFCFWTQQDFEMFQAMCRSADIGPLVAVDKANIVDSVGKGGFLVDERE